MKAILLLFGGLVATIAVPQNGTNYSAQVPTVQLPALQTAQFAADTGVVLQELSPPQRPGRRGGVYVTGAPPVPTVTTRIYVPATNLVGTNGTGATSSTTLTTRGSNETQGMNETEGIFVPTFNNPGLPGAIGGRGVPSTASGSSPANTTTPAPNATVPFVRPLGAPAGTLGPALPPSGTVTPPPGLGDLPGRRIVPPPRPITNPPPPITGPSR